MRTNSDFLKSLSTSVARFYLADFHVHSPGSADICIGERFESLSDEEKDFLTQLKSLPEDLAKYDSEIHSDFPVSDFYNLLIERRNKVASEQGITSGMDWALVGITDHNVSEYAASLSKFAWDRRQVDRLIVLPGIELDVSFDVASSTENPCDIHILCLFAPCTKSSDIRLAIAGASETNWEFGTALKVPNLSKFVDGIRKHEAYPAICIAAHVWSSKGIQKEANFSLMNSAEAEIARIEGEITEGSNVDKDELQTTLDSLKEELADKDDIRQKVLQLIGACGFDALQVRGKHEETHYRRLHRFRPEKGRAIPISCSDSHCVGNIFSCGETTSYMKLSEVNHSKSASEIFDEIRERGLRYGETRTCFTNPGSVATWIEGIEIVPDSGDAATFWPFESSPENHDHGPRDQSFTLSLSRNLNCLIGGRGSGKSSALEAIGFVACAGDTGKETDDDWYRRAKATLSGCSVRICWKSTGIESFDQLRKKSLFVSRYFDPNNQHAPASVTDLDGKEVLSHSVETPKINLFRIHEIEAAADPEKLRELFDQICGDEIVALNEEITEIRNELAGQRIEMVEVAETINELFNEPSALGEYAKRKQQFLDVNRPEVKKTYQAIDYASSAELIAQAATDDWNKKSNDFAFMDAKASIEEFFDEFEAKSSGDDGKARTNCEAIYKLVGPKDDAVTEVHFREKVIASIDSAEQEISTFGQRLTDAHDGISILHKNAREELTKQGFPTGGKDRETKKKAFEQAENALSEYKSLQARWADLIKARSSIYKQLEQNCIRRTELRKETAQKLTTDLSRDLDSNVLVIEADAQPVAERVELFDWLVENLWPKHKPHRQARLDCLVKEKELQPTALRELLLSPDLNNVQLLINDKARAEDGQISEEFAKSMLGECSGRIRLNLEMTKEETTDEFWEDLPAEIKKGLSSFPKGESSDSLNIDAVLKLDEIVFDDIPIVRLNDRPLDAQSTARPLSELSPGQRCSAILPILLLTGDCPLVIDQPEDNLDNRLIRQVIVNILASIKLRRQVIVATHNPNLPVLGDAEQAVILRAVGERQCKLETRGDLDSSEVVRYVTDIMEGGREAFQYRQTIYEPHWRGNISE